MTEEKTWEVKSKSGEEATIRGGYGTYWIDFEGGTLGPFDSFPQARRETTRLLLRIEEVKSLL